jgi:hypothetical protein
MQPRDSSEMRAQIQQPCLAWFLDERGFGIGLFGREFAARDALLQRDTLAMLLLAGGFEFRLRQIADGFFLQFHGVNVGRICCAVQMVCSVAQPCLQGASNGSVLVTMRFVRTLIWRIFFRISRGIMKDKKDE